MDAVQTGRYIGPKIKEKEKPVKLSRPTMSVVERFGLF